MKHLPFNREKAMCGTPLKALKPNEVTVMLSHCDCDACLQAEDDMGQIDFQTELELSKLRNARNKKYIHTRN